MERTGTTNETGLEIAVIGMACRFPGAKNIAEFWANLKNGVESISFLSEEELAEMSPEVRNHPGFVKAKGGELEDSEYFDAPFFNYTPLEAEHMQPQIRIFHECLWTALEDAGCDPDNSSGLIGVYASLPAADDWEMLSKASPDVEQSIMAANFLNNRDFLSTIVSYKLNLTGPSFVINTACSTSLVAIHLASQGLLGGDCDIALASGVSINYQRIKGYLYQEGGICSPDGHCRAFDASANGTRGGDGAGVVVLKRLEDSVEEGDHIYAVIKGSAINNDGNRKVGFMAPSIDGQAYVIRKALKMAEIDMETVRFIEAHGTATPLGDVTEVAALKIAFNTAKKHYCSLGSVKTNIGHLGEAAGMAGFIKTVLALENRQIPPSLLYKNPNPEIDFENSPFYVNTTLEDLKNENPPLRAGVSSFGIGGTNAHVILEEYREPNETPPANKENCYLFLMSAKTQTALEKMTENLVKYFKKNLLNQGNHENPINPGQNPGLNLANVSYTLQTGRKSFPYRRKWVSAAIHETIEKLSSNDTRNIQSHHLTSGEKSKKVIFMFPGLGSQYINMGLDLYQTEPVFREEMDRCFEILKSLMDDDIKAILYPQGLESEESEESEDPRVSEDPGTPKNRSYIQRIEIAQVVIFILEYALAKLLMAWGIRPHALIGYSFGEYAAACISGVFAPAEILRLLAARGKLISRLAPGMMLGVPLPVKEVKPLLKDPIVIAIDNGTTCVVSGPAAAVKAFENEIKKKKIMCMPLEAAHAIHSPMMDPILEEFTAEAAKISLKPPQIPYISTVTGTWIKVEDAVSPGYWARQLRETVCFARGIQNLHRDTETIFLAVGPGREIGTLVEREINKNSENGENGDRPKIPVIHLVRQPKKAVPDDYYLLDKIGLLWLYGVKIDWPAYYAQKKRQRLPLPTYPFDKHRFWRLPEQRKTGTAVKQDLNRDREMTDCFWVPSWKQTVSPRALSPDTDTPENKTTNHPRLVFLDKNEKRYRGRFAVNLVNRLKQKGCQVITVARGETFSHEGDGKDHHYIINPNREEDYQALIRDINSRGKEKFPDMIIHLWTLSSGEADPGGKSYFQQQQVEGYYSLLYLAQALVKQGVGRNLLDIDENSLFLRIEIVSDHLHAVSGEDEIYAEKAPITGLCKTIPQEYPNITCRSLDIKVPAGGGPGEARLIDRLMTEFTCPVRDLTAAYRGNTRWVKFYEPIPLEPVTGDPVLLRRKGVYLITGGLGNDSFIRARYLAETFRARLVLTGRTPLPERDYWPQYLMVNGDQDPVSIKIKRIQELENLGAEVMALGADAADELDMHRVMQQLEQRFGALNGVIHAAGVTDIDMSQLVLELGPEQSERHFQPKVYGLYVLDKILAGRKPDFCLLTSSIATAIAGIGFSAYTAANIFMDAFARRKNNNGGTFPWIVLNWFGTGPEETVEAFKRVLSVHGLEQVVYSQLDLPELIRRRIDLKSLEGKARQSRGRRGDQPVPVYERPALSTPYTAPRNAAEQKLAEIWQRFFGIDKIGVTDDIFDLGGDSLKAMNILAIVQKELNFSIPLKEFFDNPTIAGVAKYISESEETPYREIKKAEEKDFYELSFNQQRLWFIQQMNPASSAYNTPGRITLNDEVEDEWIEKTLARLAHRHESLRTGFKIIDGRPVQYVVKGASIPLKKIDISRLESEEKQRKQEEIFKEMAGAPFDLTEAPPFRAVLLKLDRWMFEFLFNMHHIITDGWSMAILKREFSQLYEGYRRGRVEELPGLPVQYKDFALWQNRQLENQEGIKSLEFWKKKIGQGLPAFQLRKDSQEPGESAESAGYKCTLEKEVKDKLKQIAAASSTTIFVVMYAILNLLLYRLSGQEDLVTCILGAGRQHESLQHILGFFVNTLIMKNHVAENETFIVFLKRLNRDLLEILEHQDYPLELVFEQLDMKFPDIPLLFNMFNLDGSALRQKLDASELEPYHVENMQDAKFEMVIFLAEYENAVQLDCWYWKAAYKKERIHYMMQKYLEVLKAVAADPNRPIKQYLFKEKAKKRKVELNRKEE